VDDVLGETLDRVACIRRQSERKRDERRLSGPLEVQVGTWVDGVLGETLGRVAGIRRQAELERDGRRVSGSPAMQVGNWVDGVLDEALVKVACGRSKSVPKRYAEGGEVGGLDPRPDIAGVRVARDTSRDVVGEALRKGAGKGWNRDEVHGRREGLRPMQVRGNTGPVGHFTFHDAFCGMGGGSLGMVQAGGKCVGAFDSKKAARQVFQRNVGVAPLQGLGSVTARSLGSAEVYLAGSPCQDYSVNGDRYGSVGPKGRLMFDQLRLVKEAAPQYQMLVFEQVPNFECLDNGAHFRRFKQEVEGLGYTMYWETLFAPDFGSVSARRRMWMVAVRNDLASRVGPFVFPEAATEHYPLKTVLEPAAIRDRSLLVRRSRYTALQEPKQRNNHSLIQMGFVDGGGEGRRVYSADGFAATQKTSGRGPGWASGLYMVEDRVSRLSLREAARAQQFEDTVQLHEDESTARKHIGNAMPVGMVRAVGAEVGRYLEAFKESIGAVPVQEPAENGCKDSSENRWRWSGLEAATALHAARMAAIQASAAAAAVLERCEAALGPAKGAWATWQQLSETAQQRIRRMVERAHWRRWLKLQTAAGLKAVRGLQAGGASAEVVAASAASVAKTMRAERDRGCGSEGPVNLLWWNWPPDMWTEIRDGFELPFVTKPAKFKGENYESAACEKVFKEFDRLIKLGYLVELVEEECEVISSISAVPKKNSVKLRVVIDMSASGLNGCLLPPRFMLPTVEEVAQEAYPGCWFVVTDLSDGFYCQRLHDGSLAYLGVRNPADGKLYAYRRLPMGLGVSPHNFSRKVAVAVCEAMKNLEEFKVHEWRVNDSCPFMPRVYPVDEKGMPVASLKYYVDDGIITAASKEAAEKAYKKLAWFLEARLGLVETQPQEQSGSSSASAVFGAGVGLGW
jgi:DNA (cytosine-5)-methyltransferase 1